MAKEEKTVEQIAAEINTSIEGLKSSIKEKADLTALNTKFDEIKNKLDKLVDKDGNALLPKELTKQQEQLDEISTKMKQLGEHQDSKGKSTREELYEKLKSEDFQKKAKALSGRDDLTFELKAANIATAQINSGTIETQVEPGVSAAPWRNTPIFDNVNKGTIGQGRDSVSWWEETTRTDSAQMVAENAAPAAGSAKTWTKRSMDIMMIKDYTKVSKSALEDFEYITSEVNDLIANGIPRKRETQLLSGVGTTVYLKGLTQYAQTFALPANFDKVPSPNSGDVLAAAVLQCMNGYTADTNKKGFLPNLILINPGDSTNMRLIKNSVFSYITHPLLSPVGNQFKGITIAESLDLDAGQFIVGDFSRAKAYLKRTMNISFHYENEDDVLNDLVLVLASERIAGLKITAADAYAFVTGTFAAGKSLIEEVIG
jgi:HK97 family phage major capsid protein